MTRVAVIGSNGQLGTDIVKALEQTNKYDISSLSHVDIEVTNQSSVITTMESIKPNIVINCAAFVRVDDCENDPETAFNINSIGALNVARACKELNAICVYISTGYVFDGKRNKPYMEEDVPSPINVYGASKLSGEILTQNYCTKNLVLRTSGLYGTVGSSGKGGNFVETMLRLACDSTTIQVVNDQVVTPTYTKDLSKKIVDLLQLSKHGVYHITNEGECSWYEFAKEIFRLSKKKVALKPIKSIDYSARALRPAYSVLGHNLKQIGNDNLRSWDSALKDYMIDRKP